jgi:putative membrane protein
MQQVPAAGLPERLHWSSLLSSLAAGIKGMWGLFAAGAYFASQGRWLLILVSAVIFTAFSLGAALIRWSRFRYSVSDDQIRIDSGVISRVHRSIPFDRIQDVDISQGPVARLLGVAKVKFETGSGGGAEDGVLAAIPLFRAQELREHVRQGHAGLETKPEEKAPEEAQPVFAMNVRRLVLAGLFNFSLALFAGLFGATQTMGDVIGFDPFSRTFWLRLLSTGTPISDFLLEHRLAAAVAGLLILILAGIITGLVRTMLRDFSFRVDRSELGLRRRRGLFTRTDVTLPLTRVQAAVITTGPVRDRFGWRELNLQNLAQDEGGNGSHSLAPLATDSEIDRIVVELGWRPLTNDADWRPVSLSYVWTRLLWLTPLLAAALVQAAFAPWIGAIGVLLVGGAGALRFLSWRHTRYVLDDDRLRVSTGWWRRRSTVVPLSKIQSVDLSEDPVSRLFGTATIQLGVAGGRLYRAHEVPALERKTARMLRDQLLTMAA